tara:strand:- start:990 stop:1235 length:246 start_codon:yes stop_codon:yes gene_type:complete
MIEFQIVAGNAMFFASELQTRTMLQICKWGFLFPQQAKRRRPGMAKNRAIKSFNSTNPCEQVSSFPCALASAIRTVSNAST